MLVTSRGLGRTLGLALFLMGALLALSACGSGGDSANTDGTCSTNSECGSGYICHLQRCECLLCNAEDGDSESAPDGDDDTAHADGDTTQQDGDDTEADEQESEDGDSSDVVCDANTPDPLCEGTSAITCRGNLVSHDVKTCKGDDLYACDQTLDCHFPICGAAIVETKIKSCAEGCVANSDPNLDDICAEDQAPDGDSTPDGDTDSDTQADGDSESGATDGDIDSETDTDTEEPVNSDGAPCTTDTDCLPGHKCHLDIDDEGRYCTTAGSCVYHLNMSDDALPLFFQSGAFKCYSTGYRRCSSEGAWYPLTSCTQPRCEDFLFYPGQTCVSASSPALSDVDRCQPAPEPEPAACPGNFKCFNTTYCRESCTENLHCRLAFHCEAGACVAN